MSAVGHGAEIGVLAQSRWNNPEPELVLVVSPQGRIVGATLGNDVNLRDVEGRSALLLGKAKDNNASCSLGPFIRLIDDGFGLDDMRRAEMTLKVEGEDGFELGATSSMLEISRDIEDLVGQATGPHHAYPDGFVLFCGTMFAPVVDRGEPGLGFTHRMGDLVADRLPAPGHARQPRAGLRGDRALELRGRRPDAQSRRPRAALGASGSPSPDRRTGPAGPVRVRDSGGPEGRGGEIARSGSAARSPP